MARIRIRLALVGGAAILSACVGMNIGNPNDYEPVPMNRVFPYPSAEELAGQKTEIVLATRYSGELPESVIGGATSRLQLQLDRYLTNAGAGVIDRSIHDVSIVRDELEAAEGQQSIDGSGEEFTGADWALVSRITRYRHWSQFRLPTGLFKNEEELSQEPGKCTHYGEIEVDIRAFQIPTNDVPRSTFKLAHSKSFERTHFDQDCPIEETAKQIFMESILEEALSCAEYPIMNRFAPRGYIEEHRKSASGERHIYRTSMGGSNGARLGLELEVVRVQHMTTQAGHMVRDERRIGKASVSEEIGTDHSWIVVEPKNLDQPILAGDLVRAVYQQEGQIPGFGGQCKRIFSQQGEGA